MRLSCISVLLVWGEEESANCVYAYGTELSSTVASAEKSLKFLEQTIVMVEANRSKFEHIDNVRLHKRLGCEGVWVGGEF